MQTSIVIPIGPGHARHAARAIASAENQSVPVRVITVHDRDGRGAGWARNAGWRQVTTQYTLFLDADDWLELDAIEQLEREAERHAGNYVYADWFAGARIVYAPVTGSAWCGGSWHSISALIPSEWLAKVDGFDETLPAAEDTDFFLKLITSRRCGVRLDVPLLHYTGDGQRSSTLKRNPGLKQEIWAGFDRKYGGKMGCCGSIEQPSVGPTNLRQEGDVLGRARWHGNMVKIGRASLRRYPRTSAGTGAPIWMDPRDITADPANWEAVPMNDDGIPQAEGLGALAQRFLGGPNPPMLYRPTHAPTPPPMEPDIAAIIRMGQEALG